MDHSRAQASDRSTLTQSAEGDRYEQKASLRNAVRRIFRRSSKVPQTRATYHVPPSHSPRHGHHRSEPMAPAPLVSSTEPTILAPGSNQTTSQYRSLSATMHVSTNDPGINRTRSPYAVEFPRSAKLKPLDLGNPFASVSQPELQRRKTLPTMLKRDHEQQASPPLEMDPNAPPMPSLGSAVDSRADRTRPRSSSRSNRRSRSADDLQVIVGRPSAARKRSAEIRYWRQDYPNTVLRASGFTVPSARNEPQARWSNTTTSTSSGEESASPQVAHRHAISDIGNAASAKMPSPVLASGSFAAVDDATLTRDLEQRIARLENSMQTFQLSLERVAAERSRRALEAQNQESLRQSASDEAGSRSPSMLADTLNAYTPGASQFPAASRSVSRIANKTPPTTSRASERGPDRTASAMAMSARGTPIKQGTSGKSSVQSDYTFRSLYEMLADERSARRKLEYQVKGMRQDILDLKHEISNHTDPPSQRSSNVASYEFVQPPFQSSRLRDIVNDAEASPPGTSRALHIQRLSGFYQSGHESQVPRNAHQFDFGVMSTTRQHPSSQDADGDMF